ncbi:MAG: lipocalin-like domain-containing protein [Alphaproteobacteria bacterium]
MTPNDTGAEITAEQIHGTWVMVDRGTDSAEDEALGRERYGDDPQGWMILSPDGWMSGVVCWGGRPALAGDPAWHVDAPDADRLHAFDTYLSYGGRYAIENSVLTTTVEHSINPGWVGGTQVRGLEKPGDGTLILHWERAWADGHVVRGWVRWRRAG